MFEFVKVDENGEAVLRLLMAGMDRGGAMRYLYDLACRATATDLVYCVTPDGDVVMPVEAALVVFVLDRGAL